MRICGIVNPRSASGATSRKFSRIARHCQDRLGPVQWRFTEKPGDGVQLTRAALENGAELILSLGGDGTHNEAVNGFFYPDGRKVNPEASLAFLSCGTAGDLCANLAIPLKTTNYINSLSNGLKAVPVDLGLIRYANFRGETEHRFFINVASCGISGLVDKCVNTSPKWLGGTAVFYLATIRSFFLYRNTVISIQLDDRPEESATVCCLAVANTSYFGGGMMIAPQAKRDDGLLDVVCLGDFNLWDFLTKGYRLYRGTHLELDKVWSRTARRIRIQAGKEVYLDVDGETPGLLPAEIEVVPAALRVHCG